MAAIDTSKYEEFFIESADGTEVDIKMDVNSVDYYEDIFSPTVTAKINVTNTAHSTGLDETIYKGLPLVGCEKVRFKIEGNTDSNPGLDFSKKGDHLYIDKIINVLTTNNVESFTLNLVSKDAIVNELHYSRVIKKYPSTSSISGSVEKILQDVLKTEKELDIEPTSNKYGFIGNMRKPFTVITWLMTKSVSEETEGDSTAGYLFWQTVNGYHFKSIDGIISQGSVNEGSPYVFDEITTKIGRNTDDRILTYSINRNQNIIDKLRLGVYASNRSFFDPLTGNFICRDPDYKLEKYQGKSKNLGRTITLPSINEGEEETIGDVPSRMVTQILDRGTFDKDASKEGNADPMKYQSQSLMRYNTLFTQVMEMTVASNTNLKAGDIITCRFPKSNSEDNEEISGLYMIKELCHHFDRIGSWTSMKLVRDTYGLYGTNN